MRLYRYVAPGGTKISNPTGLLPFANGEPLTFVIDADGALVVADRHSEHIACARGGEVLSAGEITLRREGHRLRATAISNQSTGYCPEPESWPSVAAALDALGVAHPGGFTFAAIFRRCPKCGERNLVKDEWFVCALCDAELPREWNF